MLRDIHLYGPLAKAAGTEYVRLNVDTQAQLFSALKRRGPEMDMALRHNQFVIVTPNEDGITATCVEQGFGFGKRKELHIATYTEGSYSGGTIVGYLITAAIAVVAAVAVAYISAAMMGKNGANGPGGAKSTMFNGPVNSTDQGGAIPLVYGKKVLVGSTIISVDEDYYNTTGVSPDPVAPTPNGKSPLNIPIGAW